MFSMTFSDFVLFFTIYSFMGWVCEVVYCSVIDRKLAKRGFLHGPYCPIYGFGAMIIIVLLKPFNLNIGILFVAAVVLTSILEYVTSWAMEALFGIRWWDYSKEKLNINGRVCLKNSLMFGVLGVLLVHLINPPISNFINSISVELRGLLASTFIVVFGIDLMSTLNNLYKLNDKLKQIRSLMNTLRTYNKEYRWFDRNNIQASLERLKTVSVENNNQKLIELVDKMDNLLTKDRTGKDIIKAFPRMKYHNFEESLGMLKKSWAERKVEWKEQRSALKNKISYNFAQFFKNITVNFYKIFWIFIAASVAGYFIEVAAELIFVNQIAKVTQWYAPFVFKYGFMALFILFMTRPLPKRKTLLIFVISGILSVAFEYLYMKAFSFTTYKSSFFGMERNYKLLYIIFWGALGTWIVKFAEPKISAFIDRVPKKIRFLLTFIVVLLIIFIQIDSLAKVLDMI